MLIIGLLKMALRALWANKMRTFLTTLGMIIGVASVISMISIGEASKQKTLDTISKFGTNIITVRPGEKKTRHVATDKVTTLVLEDADAIQSQIAGITGVAAQIQQGAQLKFRNKNVSSTVRGTGKDYAWLANYQLNNGRFFGESEVRTSRKVAVLGATVVKNLFEDKNPVGETIKIDGNNYLVLGTMVAKGSLRWFDPDDQIFIPVTTAQKRLFGIDYLQSIDVQVEKIEDIERVIKDIEILMRKRHRIGMDKEDDFYVQNSAEWLTGWGDAAQSFTYLLGGISAISLMVGGIGIMNIMLVSVTERTREIGIRMAVGAKRNEIRQQFLIESILISFLGGAVGVLFGIAISKMVSTMGGWDTAVSLNTILLAFGFSVVIGIFFGFYPANKASKMNPIEALRYE